MCLKTQIQYMLLRTKDHILFTDALLKSVLTARNPLEFTLHQHHVCKCLSTDDTTQQTLITSTPQNRRRKSLSLPPPHHPPYHLSTLSAPQSVFILVVNVGPLQAIPLPTWFLFHPKQTLFLKSKALALKPNVSVSEDKQSVQIRVICLKCVSFGGNVSCRFVQCSS